MNTDKRKALNNELIYYDNEAKDILWYESMSKMDVKKQSGLAK